MEKSGSSSEKLSMKSPYDPGISLPGICSRKLKIFFQKVCHAWIFIAALFVVVETVQVSVNRSLTEIPLTLDVKDVSTEGHTKGHALYDSPHNRCPEWANTEKRKSAGDFQVLAEGRSRCWLLMGSRFLWPVVKKSQNYILVVDVQLWEYAKKTELYPLILGLLWFVNSFQFQKELKNFFGVDIWIVKETVSKTSYYVTHVPRVKLHFLRILKEVCEPRRHNDSILDITPPILLISVSHNHIQGKPTCKRELNAMQRHTPLTRMIFSGAVRDEVIAMLV